MFLPDGGCVELFKEWVDFFLLLYLQQAEAQCLFFTFEEFFCFWHVIQIVTFHESLHCFYIFFRDLDFIWWFFVAESGFVEQEEGAGELG
jgi:hypothetical protein